MQVLKSSTAIAASWHHLLHAPRDVDELAERLKKRGCKALPYHAGMESEQAQSAKAFAAEKCDIIVATVAFGMGIDRSNIRFVLHAAMPKSIEHYQQETVGRPRDGLEAECVLHSGGDFVPATHPEEIRGRVRRDDGFLPNALHLNEMDRYCRSVVCRHQALVRYFDQQHNTPVAVPATFAWATPSR